MIENIIVCFIIALCTILLGKRFFKQWRVALSKDKDILSCSGCCGCAASSTCSDRKVD